MIKKFKEFLNESQFSDIYFDTYTDAVNFALDQTEKKGYQYDPEEVADIIGIHSSRPKDGKTTRWSLPLYKNGKRQRKELHVQVYGRGTTTNNFELNHYIR
ncbi:MAG: hypothetical protein CL489_09035 [Acidobacteria bacterium]|nr:hypothetical protein [Acidobacteriota bacterium]|tara:strand:- start:26915 stop:27217 length:303 start_codon:yes stop_codon:yes gene_type:complete